MAFGYVWTEKEDPNRLSILDLEHSFNAAVLPNGTGKYFGQDGKSFIEAWRERKDTISFTRRSMSGSGFTVHLLRKLGNGWAGTWDNHLRERGFIIMWIQEEQESPFTKTVGAVLSEQFRQAFN